MNFSFKILCCLSMNIVAYAKNSRIIGGNVADLKDYPYTVAFRRSDVTNEIVCGGAIISHYHILTAAHCFMDKEIEDFKVFIGIPEVPTASDIFYKIQQLKIHPGFKGILESTEPHNDIAIATVEPCILFNEYQNKVNLPTHHTENGVFSIFTGWGDTSYPFGESSTVLRKVLMVTVTNEVCGHNLIYPIYDQNICAFHRRGIGACYGDSGGPLVSDRTLIGISSFIQPCAIGEPDIYTRVYSYMDFIMSTTSASFNLTCYVRPSMTN